MVSSGPIAVSNGRGSVQFTVAQGCNVELSLVSYKAPGPTFDESTASQQQLYDSVDMTLPAGSYTWSVAVPSCYYQVDFVYGKPIEHLGTQGFYGSRLIKSTTGGTSSCSTPPPSPPTPPVTPPAHPAAPVAPAPPASISIVKLERVGSTGDYVTGPVTAKVGDTVEYEIVVTNTGPAVSFSVSDPGCTGLAPAGTEALETGKSMTFVCSHTIVTADGSTYTNTVVATATAASGTPVTASAIAVANVAASGVLGTTTTVAPTHKQTPAHKKTQTKVKHVKKVKKVTKRAAPARARVRSAGFTG
jgi:hypothetical protein